MPTAKQGAYLGRIEAVLSPARLGRFTLSASEPAWERLARYAWNAAICEAFYPLLHGLEIVLRNRVYEFGKIQLPYRSFQHIDCWLDANPSPLTQFSASDIDKAKKKLFGIDPRTGQIRAPTRAYRGGDLVAALDFGFWTGLFGKPYLFQSHRDPRLWPHACRRSFHMPPDR